MKTPKSLYLIIITFFIIVSCIISQNHSYAQDASSWKDASVESDSDYVLCYINPNILADKDRSIVVKALLQLSLQKASLDSIKVHPNENLNLLVKRVYNFWDGEDHQTSLRIINTIKYLNSLESDMIISGQSLVIPTLPKKPDYTNSSNYTQLYDYINKRTITTDNKGLSDVNKATNKKVKQIKAGLWTYNLTRADYSYLLSIIPEETLKKIYGTALVGTSEPKFIKVEKQSKSDSVNKSKVKIEINESTKKKIDSLEKENFGKYIFFDFFNGDCSHGKKVFNVIEQIANSYKLPLLKLNVQPITANYWDNPKEALKVMEDYFESKAFDDENLKIMKEINLRSITILKREKKSDHSDDEIPELFFCTLFWIHYSSNPDILATSIFSRVHEMSIMPVIFKKNDTNCITACLNDSAAVVERISDVTSSPDGRPRGATQPLYHYYNNYLSSGFIIVGCQADSGKFSGMYSQNGDRVTTLGQGTGWGTSGSSCIQQSDLGASFATPEVGFKLYIAKAYWRLKKLKISTEEARIRLIMSTDIHENFAGKFASGGTLNINKLLTIAKGFIEINGKLKEMEVIQGSKIDTDELSGYRLARNTKNWALGGIAMVADKSYVFSESNPAWKPVNITGIKLSIKVGDTTLNINSLDDLKANGIKQIVCLNN